MAATGLDTRAARCAVAHAVDRLHHACVSRLWLAASLPTEGFTRTYDTLVIEFTPTLERLVSVPRDEVASCLREGLLLLHAVSQCPGFSFVHNLAFWQETLPLPVGPDLPRASKRFPRVALHWDARVLEWYDEASKSEAIGLFSSLLELFTSQHALSAAGQTMLSHATTCTASGVLEPTNNAIDCTVSLELPWKLREAQRAVDLVVHAACVADSPTRKNAFALSRVRIARSKRSAQLYGLSSAFLAILSGVCDALPPAVRLDVRFASMVEPSPVGANLAPVLWRAIGVKNTEFLGRLELLPLHD